MRKILAIVLLIVGMTLTGCREVVVECDPGYELDKSGECVEIIPICNDGYILNEENICVLDTSCEEGYVYQDGQCVQEIVETPLETAFENSIGMTNYQMDVTVVEDITTASFVLEFADHISRMTIGEEIEYFQQDNDVCTRITVQIDNVIEETIDCIANDDSRFQFFHGFEIEWFEQEDDHYILTEGNYNLLDNFFRTSIPGAVVSDFVLTIANDYFESFTFLVTTEDTSYQFTIDFTNINIVTIEVPVSE
jgi:hypothetical protein